MAERGRPGFLDDPENVESVAIAYIDGRTRKQIASAFGVNERTVTAWRGDPRVKARAAQLARDRILQVVRKTDSQIEDRLKNAGEMSVRELLDIRKEFITGPGFQDEAAGISPETITEVTEAMEADPDFAAALTALLEKE